VAFIVKNKNMIIICACLVGWLDSSPVEKIKAQSLKTTWAGANTGMSM